MGPETKGSDIGGKEKGYDIVTNNKGEWEGRHENETEVREEEKGEERVKKGGVKVNPDL